MISITWLKSEEHHSHRSLIPQEKSLENQRSNLKFHITKTQLALRARTQVPGQTLLVCNGTRLHNTQDVLGSIPKGNKPFPLKVLEQGKTLTDDEEEEETPSRYRTRAMLDILEAERYLNLEHFRECLKFLRLPLQLARFEGWVVRGVRARSARISSLSLTLTRTSLWVLLEHHL